MSNTAQDLKNIVLDLENYIKKTVEIEVEKKFKEKLENIERDLDAEVSNFEPNTTSNNFQTNQLENQNDDAEVQSIDDSQSLENSTSTDQPAQASSDFFQESDSSEGMMNFETPIVQNNSVSNEDSSGNFEINNDSFDNDSSNVNNGSISFDSNQDQSNVNVEANTEIPQPTTFESNFNQFETNQPQVDQNNQIQQNFVPENNTIINSADSAQEMSLGDAYEQATNNQNMNNFDQSNQNKENNVVENVNFNEAVVPEKSQANATFSKADDLLNNVINKNWKN